MSFAEPIFLFLFLPLVLALHSFSPRRARNAVLLLSSLLFYVWTQKEYVLVLLGSVFLNYACALAIGHSKTPERRRLFLWAGVGANLLLLAVFKYPTFLLVNYNRVLHLLQRPQNPVVNRVVPLGLSFFTLMALAYLIDVYREQIKPEKRLLRFATYLTLFPYVVAGPITRYTSISKEFIERRITLDDFSRGVQRFIIGLGKKILIADTLGLTVHTIFTVPLQHVAPGVAWLGAIVFALQIYFDISGYADMAIGVGLMLGFHLPENFNYPYTAQSMTDFWQRWHITLVTWFRDYLFFPMSFRRPRWRIHLNLIIVFLLCGLWHEGSWRFMAWGIAHGSLLALERVGLQRILLKLPRPARHAYVILAIVMTGVFVAATSLGDALRFFRMMVWPVSEAINPLSIYVNKLLLVTVLIAIAGCLPVVPALRRLQESLNHKLGARSGQAVNAGIAIVRLAAVSVTFVAAAAFVAVGTYRAFIYFQF